MRIRFGYVAMALGIPEGSPNKTVTASNLNKLADPFDRFSKLTRLIKANLSTQLRVLYYNLAHDIKVFRFTSKLVPLATHSITYGWNYSEEFQHELAEIGTLIKKEGIRVSAHPDHFAILNSKEQNVLEATLSDLCYHVNLFDVMGLGVEAKLVLHVGGVYQDKLQALLRFKSEFSKLPSRIKDRIIIENDDRSYNANEVLSLCEELKVPMVLDVHHHSCCNDGTALTDILPAIFATWGSMIPKIHVSSPKGTKNARAHADYINVDEFVGFLDIAKQYNQDFDVMIEAKQKDLALLSLMKELKDVEGVTIINQGAIEY